MVGEDDEQKSLQAQLKLVLQAKSLTIKLLKQTVDTVMTEKQVLTADYVSSHVLLCHPALILTISHQDLSKAQTPS